MPESMKRHYLKEEEFLEEFAEVASAAARLLEPAAPRAQTTLESSGPDAPGGSSPVAADPRRFTTSVDH